MKKENIGSSLDDFLREEGIYEEVTAMAIQRVPARQISQEMTERLCLRRRWRGGCRRAGLRSIGCSVRRMMRLR